MDEFFSSAPASPGTAPYYFRRPLILLVLLFAGAAAALQLWRPSAPWGPLDPARWADGRPALLIGRVAGHPAGTRGGDRFFLEAEWLKPSGRPAFPVRGRVLVFRRAPETPLAWGDQVTVWGPLNRSSERFTPRRGEPQAALFSPRGKSWRVRPASPWSPKRWAAAVRDRLRLSFHNRLTPAQAPLLAGLVIGQRSPEIAGQAEEFRRAGTYHLLVASGSNVGLVLFLWWGAARWALWWPRRWVMAAMPFWAFLYAAVAGGEAPVLRAALMASFVTVGHLLGRWDRLEHPLFLSLGVLLALDPAAIFDPGLQMSYAATLGIATLMPRWEPWLRGLPGGFWMGPARWTLRLVLMSFAAQLALAPILLHHFGRLSLVGLLGNVVAAPLAGLGLGLGVALAILDGWAPEALCRLAAGAAGWSVDALVNWSRLCARAPWAEWRVEVTAPEILLLSTAVIGSFLLFAQPRRRWWGLAPLWAAAGFAFVLLPGAPRPPLELLWGPAGRGAVLVKTPAGKTLVDFSETDAERRGSFLHADELRGLSKHMRLAAAAEPQGPLNFQETVWDEGEVRWTLIEAQSGDGAGILLEWRGQRALLCARLTERAAEALVRRAGPCDVVGWLPRTGAPKAWLALEGLKRRYLVFQGRAVTRAIRRQGTGLFSAGKQTVRWTAGPRGARLAAAPGAPEPLRVAPPN